MAMAMAMDRSIIVLLGASRVCILGDPSVYATAHVIVSHTQQCSSRGMGVTVRVLPPLVLDRSSRKGMDGPMAAAAAIDPQEGFDLEDWRGGKLLQCKQAKRYEWYIDDY